MADLLERVAGPLAGCDDGWAHVVGLRLVAFDGLTVDVPDTAANAAAVGRRGGGVGAGHSRRCGSWRWPSAGPGR
jgi:hypothetical protein